jgi:hypothetical protein
MNPHPFCSQFDQHFTLAFFLYKSALCSFFYLHFSFVIFGAKISAQKFVRKMLMKLTPAFAFLKLKHSKLPFFQRHFEGSIQCCGNVTRFVRISLKFVITNESGWKFSKPLKIFVTFRCFHKAIIHRK